MVFNMEMKCAFLDVNVEGKVASVHAMNAYGTMEVQLHSFSTSTLRVISFALGELPVPTK
jgi:hypothetical protein